MKSPIIASLSALGSTPWIPLNYLQRSFAVSLAVVLSSGAVLTYTVQHTYDEPGPDAEHAVSIARATTVATVTDPLHKLSVGDTSVIYGSGSSQLNSQTDVAGRMIPWQVATVVDANNYTYTVANAGPAAAGVLTRAKNFRVFNHSVLANLSARGDSNYNFPPQATRLIITAYTSGTADFIINQGQGL